MPFTLPVLSFSVTTFTMFSAIFAVNLNAVLYFISVESESVFIPLTISVVMFLVISGIYCYILSFL